jgi:hypothetical protein
MHYPLECLFDDAENQTQCPLSLKDMHRYMQSLPERIKAYRILRDHEVEILQAAAQKLKLQFRHTSQPILERCLRHGMLVLQHCAMAMLMNDEQYLEERLLGWLRESSRLHATAEIDQLLYPYLRERLRQILSTRHVDLLEPFLKLAMTALLNPLELNDAVEIARTA